MTNRNMSLSIFLPLQRMASGFPSRLPIKKDLKRDGQNPTLIYGYGAYGGSSEAHFHSNIISILDRGFVFAIAHVRGGSEMGRSWYDEGRLMHKKNSFTDLIACAEHLTGEGFTSPEKLAVIGSSAGGLLVGASMVMRPDLFKVSHLQSPVPGCGHEHERPDHSADHTRIRPMGKSR
jgi:oligopeptidase B